MTTEATDVEIRKAVAKLLSGNCPSIPKRIVDKLNEMGLDVQEESPRHEGRLCYPMWPGTFVDLAKKLFGKRFVGLHNSGYCGRLGPERYKP